MINCDNSSNGSLFTHFQLRKRRRHWETNKKLSYRKQITHQLRTQYVYGIYSKSV